MSEKITPCACGPKNMHLCQREWNKPGAAWQVVCATCGRCGPVMEDCDAAIATWNGDQPLRYEAWHGTWRIARFADETDASIYRDLVKPLTIEVRDREAK